MSGLWESLSPPWQVCLEEAWDAYCAGSIPIGAAITNGEGRIVARGRNRFGDAHGVDGAVGGSPLAHAELNALISLDLFSIDPHPYSLYTTTEPCPLCLGALYMSGVRTCHYASRDPYAGSANLLGTTPYLSRKPMRLIGPEDDDLELAVMVLFVDYSIAYSGSRSHPVFDEMQRLLPQSVALGQSLYDSGMARQWRSQACSVAEAWNALGEFLQA